MKYMATWTVQAGMTEAVAKAFLESGAKAQEGHEILGRWHQPGSNKGWVLVQGDITAIAAHMAEWGKYLHIELTPVIEDDQAGEAMARIYG